MDELAESRGASNRKNYTALCCEQVRNATGRDDDGAGRWGTPLQYPRLLTRPLLCATLHYAGRGCPNADGAIIVFSLLATMAGGGRFCSICVRRHAHCCPNHYAGRGCTLYHFFAAAWQSLPTQPIFTTLRHLAKSGFPNTDGATVANVPATRVGVFQRAWSGGTVKLDCNAFVASGILPG